MKNILRIVLVLLIFGAYVVFAENPNDLNTMEPIISDVEGASRPIEVKVKPEAKVSGDALDLPEGPKFKESPLPILLSEMINTDDISSIFPWSPSGLKQKKPIEPFDIGSPAPESKGSKWGNDFLIYSGTVRGIDWDIDVSTGDLYAIIDQARSTYDSMIVYRSTDGGETWNFWRTTYDPSGSMSNVKIRVANDKNNQTWICMCCIAYNSGDYDLLMRRMTPDQSQQSYVYVSDSVSSFDVDADIGDSAYVYVTYIPMGSPYEVWAARNDLSGSWENDQQLFYDPQTIPYPQIAAGAGGNVAVAFIDTRITTNDEVRVKRSTNYGVSWSGSQQVSNNTGAYPLSYTDIAYNHTTTQTGWIWVTYNVGELNVGYYYTTNSGVDWTYGGIMPSSVDEYEGNIRAWKTTSSGAVTVGYRVAPGDSVNFTWANTSSPTSFSTPHRINDYSVTLSVHPMAVAGWNSNYSAIMYVGWGPSNAYFDWFGNTAGVDEEIIDIANFIKLAPNPSYDKAELSYVVRTEGHIHIALFDVSGRLISNLVNEVKSPGQYICNINNKNLSSGIYFLHIITPDGKYTKSMTVVR